MSTLAAARADNFYYPPEWDPSKGSLNKVRIAGPAASPGSWCYPTLCISSPPLTVFPSDAVSGPTSAERARKEARPGHPGNPLRDALQCLVQRLRPSHRQGRAFQRGEEADRQLLFHKDMELLHDIALLQRAHRSANRSQEPRVPCGGGGQTKGMCLTSHSAA